MGEVWGGQWRLGSTIPFSSWWQADRCWVDSTSKFLILEFLPAWGPLFASVWMSNGGGRSPGIKYKKFVFISKLTRVIVFSNIVWISSLHLNCWSLWSVLEKPQSCKSPKFIYILKTMYPDMHRVSHSKWCCKIIPAIFTYAYDHHDPYHFLRISLESVTEGCTQVHYSLCSVEKDEQPQLVITTSWNPLTAIELRKKIELSYNFNKVGASSIPSPSLLRTTNEDQNQRSIFI